jgi:hypothetical protein
LALSEPAWELHGASVVDKDNQPTDIAAASLDGDFTPFRNDLLPI